MPPEVQFCSLLCKQNWRSYQPIVQGLPTVLSAIQFSTNLPRVYGIRQFTSNARPYTEYTIYCVMDIYASSHSELIWQIFLMVVMVVVVIVVVVEVMVVVVVVVVVVAVGRQ